MADWEAAWSHWSVETEQVLDAPPHVIAMIRQSTTGQSTGLELDRTDAIIFAIEAQLIVRVEYYNSPADALKAAGLGR